MMYIILHKTLLINNNRVIIVTISLFRPSLWHLHHANLQQPHRFQNLPAFWHRAG